MNRRRFLVGAAVGIAPALLNLRGAPILLFPATWQGTLKLNSNENALGLSEGARKAIQEGLGRANRYPMPDAAAMKDRLAQGLGIPAENILLGSGSSQILHGIVQAFARASNGRGTLLQVNPTFESMGDAAKAHPIRVRDFPLGSHYAHPIGAMARAARQAQGPTLVYICNPNNPTGTLTPCKQVAEWIEQAPSSVWFLVDEAYFEFVRDDSYESLMRLALRRPHTYVARTFSKIYAMAGLRLGYAVARAVSIRQLEPFLSDLPVSNLALRAGLACYGDEAFLRRSYESNRESRAILLMTLDELGIEHLPSHTNFVMHRVSGRLETYIERMKEAGVLVGRPFPPMVSWNRLSMGTPEEMGRFCEVLRDFRRRNWI